ncbi:hypothetical protein CEG14_20440 [Bordetella genomosp. 1]|uniref:Structural protein MipA n=1 Tax=Bordetella genomosp. 1 TaxID=1395607 RepID=A0A261S7Y0_9BORD|nr:MipA/OmpV family protein [Bordetella genomosp. 1]OZI33211.1 hypothetical protein CEG14_20440 [Bordetella genomosp. 1]
MSSPFRYSITADLKPRALALALAVSVSIPLTRAFAQSLDPISSAPGQATALEREDSKWGIGIGAGINYRVYRDFDDRVRALPLLTFENDYVQLIGLGLDVKLPSLGPVSFRLRGRYIGEDYDSGDSPYLSGMQDRNSSFWVGGIVTWRTALVNLSAEVLTDVMSNSDGRRAKFQIDRRFAAGAFGFTPRLAAEWVDGNYVDYYYGVRPSEARSWRPAYSPGSAINTEVGLRIDWEPVRQHNLYLDAGATRMGSAIRNSPLVDESTQWGFGLGYLYRF